MRCKLLPICGLAIPLGAAADRAEVREEIIDVERCGDVYIPNPRRPGEGIWVTHCADLDGVHRWISTPSGNEIHTFRGDFEWWDYDMDGELVAWQYEDLREFSLSKDESGHWFVHHADIERCADTPWGFSILYSLHDQIVDGEVVFRVFEGGEIESCEGW